MRFKLQTDYALRAMVYMASKDGNCTTDEIASYFEISSAHLGRVIRRLQSHGYVKAIRGRRGGVHIDRDPSTITLGEVVETLEEGAQPLDPPHGEPSNGVDQNLRLKAVLRRAHGLFLNYLNKVTLAELAAEGLPPKPAPAATDGSNAADSEQSRSSDLPADGSVGNPASVGLPQGNPSETDYNRLPRSF